MKQFFLFFVSVLVLFSCSGGKNKQAEASAVAYGLDNLLAVAEQEVDKTVTVVGYVTHTCKHSGKRCFIVGESQAVSLRVEIDPEGEIEMFTPELIGSKLAITGILKEEHWSEEDINERENNVEQFRQAGGSSEVCTAELSNISDMRKWMMENNKNYYIIYYMDGLKYELLD